MPNSYGKKFGTKKLLWKDKVYCGRTTVIVGGKTLLGKEKHYCGRTTVNVVNVGQQKVLWEEKQLLWDNKHYCVRKNSYCGRTNIIV